MSGTWAVEGRGSQRRAGILAMVMLFLGPGAMAEGASPGSATVVAPYIVGVAAFTSGNIAPGKSLLLTALPRLIVAELSPLPPRHDPDSYLGEKTARLEMIERYSLGAELARCLDELALRTLEPGIDDHRRVQNRLGAEAKVVDARKRLDEKTAPSGSLPPATSRPARLLQANADGGLVSVGDEGPAAAARAASVDLLVTGTAEDLGEYVAVTVTGWETSLGRELFSWREYVSADDPAPLASALAGRVIQVVAGRPFGRIDIALVPESARVSIDGMEVAAGTRSLFYFAPATLRVSASAPSRTEASADVELALGERKELLLQLDQAIQGRITARTVPEGLSLFLDGLPAGSSPQEIPLGSGMSVLTAFDRDGNRDEAVVWAGGPDNVVLAPSPGRKAAAAKVTDGRRAFYRSLGWFVLSLPPVSLAYGQAYTYGEAAALSGDPGMLSKYNVYMGATGVMAAGSLALATIAVIRLVDYVGAAR